ncbi:hypothetical protein E2C01_019602 [Portunus trituberculatus]|uniref:Uncharacterized protein n=1 Tax=Portunus trituberculatus TaxID=210409 RepID=A0A5B7DZU1_PORTR|nr:hypothetical protein [Portunus trituberculatus]
MMGVRLDETACDSLCLRRSHHTRCHYHHRQVAPLTLLLLLHQPPCSKQRSLQLSSSTNRTRATERRGTSKGRSRRPGGRPMTPIVSSGGIIGCGPLRHLIPHIWFPLAQVPRLWAAYHGGSHVSRGLYYYRGQWRHVEQKVLGVRHASTGFWRGPGGSYGLSAGVAVRAVTHDKGGAAVHIGFYHHRTAARATAYLDWIPAHPGRVALLTVTSRNVSRHSRALEVGPYGRPAAVAVASVR